MNKLRFRIHIGLMTCYIFQEAEIYCNRYLFINYHIATHHLRLKEKVIIKRLNRR